MYRIVALVLCYQALSQPVTDEPLARQVRELTECCPCPGSDDGGQDMVGSEVPRAGGPDDCPCMPRAADSDGAPSMLFPSVARTGPHVRPIDPKEDPKNLLEPEVALATSMLDTLREATEEEYQEALARDAARSAAETDTLPEESARNVVIIVSPRDSDNDDFIAEASHVQESRCIHPLESTSLGKVRSSTKPITVFPQLKFPKLKFPSMLHANSLNRDSHLEASNIEESIVGGNDQSQKFQSHTRIFKPPLKNDFGKSNDAFDFEKPNTIAGQLGEGKSSFFNGLKSQLTPKLKSQTSLIDEDLATAPSSVQQQLEKADEKTSPLFKHAKQPLNLRNFLKLRDVELIPKTIQRKPFRKPKLDLSKFAIPTYLTRNQKENDHKNNQLLKSSSSLENKDVSAFTINDSNFDDCELPEDKENNLDPLPSPSQVETTVIGAENERERVETLENFTENISNRNSLEMKEPENANQIEETLDESKELVPESIEPESDRVLIDKNSEGANDYQNLEIEEVLQDEDLDPGKDSDTDSSNKISTIVPLDTQERTNDAINQESIEPSRDPVLDDSCSREDDTMSMNLEKPISHEEISSHINGIPSLRETMSNQRENNIKLLEKLKKPSVKSDQSLGMISNKDNNIVGMEQGGNIINEDPNPYSILNLNTNHPDSDIMNSSEETGTDISIRDLQDMSDKLLGFDSSKTNEKLTKAAECEIKPEGEILKLDEASSDVNIDNSETKQDAPISVRDLSLDTNTGSKEGNKCSTVLENRNALNNEEKSSESAIQDVIPKEMETGASETFVNTLPGIWDSLNSNLKLRTPVLDDIVLQPAADPLNLLSKPLNVLNLNTKLPTIEEIRERLANIFNTNDRSAEYCSGSLETDSSHDAPLKTMTPAASTTNPQIKLPTVEILNADIFQTKPSSIPSRNLLNPRKLDINSYRTKVPIPKKLNLKPVKIESALGKKVEVDRPWQNFGSDRSVGRYAKPHSLLANPLDKIPTLEELKQNLRSNSRNLLNRPVDPSLNLFNENLLTNDVEDIAENFRVNTQKTMKGLHKKIKNTLKKTSLENPLGDTFVNPIELLEDMNDKLKAIHYDLNDRLSSIHENILDSTKIKTLLDKPRKAANRNVMTNLQRNKGKSIPSRLQTAASTVSTQEIDPNEYNANQRNFILGSEPRNTLKKEWREEGRVPSPVGLEIPKSENPSSSYLQTTPPIRPNPSITQFLRERKPLSDLYETNRAQKKTEDVKSSIFRTSASPFNYRRQPNKVTISFGTTTAKPISSPRPVSVPKLLSPRFEEYDPNISSDINEEPRERIPVPNHKLKSTRVPPIKFKPLRTTAPIPSSYEEEFEDSMNNFSEEQNLLTNYNSRPSVLRETPDLDVFRMRGNTNRLKSAHIFDDREQTEIPLSKSSYDSSFDWPKAKDDSFLSKVSDAFNTRKSNNNFKHIKKLETEQSEMLRSPSENKDIVFDEPLKENVSYRCRMVCTKEIR